MGKYFEIVSVVLVIFGTITPAYLARLENLRPLKKKILMRQEMAEEIPAQTPYPPAGFTPAIPFNLPSDEKLVAPVNYYLPPLPTPANFNAAPAEVYGPPAKTYGPPEVIVKNDAEEVGDDQTIQSEVQPAEEPSSSEQPEDKRPVEVQPEEQPQETATETATEEEENEELEESQEASALPDDSLKRENREPVVEEDFGEEVPEAVEETVSNALPERIVIAKIKNKNIAELVTAKVKSARLRSAKIQFNPIAPVRRQAFSAQPIYLVGGSLYSYNGQLFRL